MQRTMIQGLITSALLVFCLAVGQRHGNAACGMILTQDESPAIPLAEQQDPLNAIGNALQHATTPGADSDIDSDMQSGVQSETRSQSEPWSQSEIIAAQQFGSHISVAEWLGPMAPVALSPFFGITCLSGMARFGGNWISHTNPLLGTNSPLHNPAVFWTFLALTILTSVPRLTKVSKPFAQAVDQLEAWSGIITMIVLRVLLETGKGADPAPELVQLGIISLSVDMLMMVAAAINILVINTVKFFFETLIWITPIPFLDAVFEFLNKSACAALMAIYAWSPLTATGINLAMFAVCFIAFGWIYRREVFMRTILIEAIIALLWKQPPATPVTVFPCSSIGLIRPRCRCRLRPTDTGWQLVQPRIFRSAIVVEIPSQPASMRQGLICNTLRFKQQDIQLSFGRQFNQHIVQLAEMLNVTIENDAANEIRAGSRTKQLRTELG